MQYDVESCVIYISNQSRYLEKKRDEEKLERLIYYDL